MHIIAAFRGEIECQRRFIKELSSKYLPMKINGKMQMINVRVCPVELYDVSFAKEHLDTMLNTLFGRNDGKPINKRVEKITGWLRKILRLQTMPKERNFDIGSLPLLKENIETIFIGIKEDGVLGDGETEGI